MKVSDKYRSMGVEEFYIQKGGSYRNPHEFAVKEILVELLSEIDTNAYMLDLACGSGESTLAMEQCGMSKIDSIDPYTHEAFRRRVGRQAEKFTFEQIANGGLKDRKYDVIVCSFAMHLMEVSRLPTLCYQLSTIAECLIIITPIKRPEIKRGWGWTLEKETMKHRVKARTYQSMTIGNKF